LHIRLKHSLVLDGKPNYQQDFPQACALSASNCRGTAI